MEPINLGIETSVIIRIIYVSVNCQQAYANEVLGKHSKSSSFIIRAL